MNTIEPKFLSYDKAVFLRDWTERPRGSRVPTWQEWEELFKELEIHNFMFREDYPDLSKEPPTLRIISEFLYPEIITAVRAVMRPGFKIVLEVGA